MIISAYQVNSVLRVYGDQLRQSRLSNKPNNTDVHAPDKLPQPSITPSLQYSTYFSCDTGVTIKVTIALETNFFSSPDTENTSDSETMIFFYRY